MRKHLKRFTAILMIVFTLSLVSVRIIDEYNLPMFPTTQVHAVSPVPIVAGAALAFLGAAGFTIYYSSGTVVSPDGVSYSITSLIKEYGNGLEDALLSLASPVNGIITFPKAVSNAMANFINWLITDKMANQSNISETFDTININGNTYSLGQYTDMTHFSVGGTPFFTTNLSVGETVYTPEINNPSNNDVWRIQFTRKNDHPSWWTGVGEIQGVYQLGGNNKSSGNLYTSPISGITSVYFAKSGSSLYIGYTGKTDRSSQLVDAFNTYNIGYLSGYNTANYSQSITKPNDITYPDLSADNTYVKTVYQGNTVNTYNEIVNNYADNKAQESSFTDSDGGTVNPPVDEPTTPDLTGIATILQDIKESILSFPLEYFNDYITTIPEVLSGLVESVTSLPQTIINGLDNLIGDLPTLVQDINDTLTTIPQTIVNTANNIIGGIESGVTTLTGTITSGVSSLAQSISGVISSIADASATLGEAVYDGVQSLTESLVDTVGSAVDTITDTLKPTFDFTQNFIMDVPNKFPFSIPFDIIELYKVLNVAPEAPQFTIPIHIPQVDIDYTMQLDFSEFETLAQILRIIEIVAFCIGLALATRGLING